MARDAIHHLQATGVQRASASKSEGNVAHAPHGVSLAAASGGNVIALSQVVTAWAPREILAIGQAESQEVRAALESSLRSDCRITWIVDAATEIEPARYDLVWALDRFALADDPAAECALRQIRDGLAAGGRLVVPIGPDVGVPSPDTDLFDRWFCFHRTGADLTRLAIAAGFAEGDISLRKDPTSGNLTLIASKGGVA